MTEQASAPDLAQQKRIRRLEEALRGLLACPCIADRDTDPGWRCDETDEAERRARAALFQGTLESDQ